MAELGVESRRFDPKHTLLLWEFTEEETLAKAGNGTIASTCSKGGEIMGILLECPKTKEKGF